MANQFSDPNLYFRMTPVDPTNWDIAFKGLQYKQGQYDANKLEVESLIQQYLSTDIVKAEAKERFSNNIKTLVNEINAAGGTDFSSRDLTNAVKTHIGKALDEPTLNAIAVSKQLRNQQGFLEELRLKKPDLYSDINYQDMLRKKGSDGKSFNDWLNDGDATSSFRGQLNYVPYVDVEKKVHDGVMELMKLNKDDIIEVPDMTDPSGLTMKKVKVSGLNETQLRSIVEYGLSESDRQQLQINARASYGWYETPESLAALKKDTEDFIGPSLNKNSQEIARLNVELAKAEKGSEQYKKISEDLKIAKINEDYFNKLDEGLANAMSQDQLDKAAFQIYAAKFSNNMVNKYKPLYEEKVVGYSVNEIQKTKMEFELEYMKEANRQAAKAASKAPEDLGISVLDNTDAYNNIEDLDNKIRTENQKLADTTIQSARDYVANLDKIISNGSDLGMSTEANLIKTSYTLKLKAGLHGKMSQAEINAEFRGKTLTELMEKFDPQGTVFAESIETMGGSELKTAVSSDGSRNFAYELKKTSSEYLATSRKLKELERKSLEELAKDDNGDSLKSLVSGNYKVNIVKNDGSIGVTNLNDLLKLEGLIDANGNLKSGAKISDSKYKEHIERTFLAQKALKSKIDPYSISMNPYGLSFANLSSDSKETLIKLAKSLGEDPNEVVVDPDLGDSNSGGVPILGTALDYMSGNQVFAKKGSKLEAFLERANKSFFGVYKADKLVDNSTYTNYYSKIGNFKESRTYQRGLEEIAGNLPNTKVISLDSSTKEGKNIIRMVNSNINEGGLGSAKDTVPVIIAANTDGSYELKQKAEKDGKTEIVSLGSYTKEEIARNAPNAYNSLNFEKEKILYTRESMDGGVYSTKPIKFWSSYTPERNANEVLKGDLNSKVYLRTTDAILAMGNDPIVMEFATRYDNNLPEKIKKVMDNSANYKIQVGIKSNGLEDYLDIQLFDINDRSVVYSTQVVGNNIDNIKDQLDHTPQIIFSKMLRDIIAENYQNNSTNLTVQTTKQPVFTEAYKNLFN